MKQLDTLVGQARFSARTSYDQLLVAVSLVIGHGRASVTKDLYPKVAVLCNTTPQCVERNIRTQRDIIWRDDRSRRELCEACGLLDIPEERPGGGAFLIMLAEYVRVMEAREAGGK